VTAKNRRGDITEADFHPPERPHMLEGTYVMRLAPI
jgi:hypothetical protein